MELEWLTLQALELRDKNKMLTNIETFEPNDLIYLLAPYSSSLQSSAQKFSQDYIGPLAIDTKLDDTHYLLKDVTGRTLPGDYHINRIKRAKEVMPDGLADMYEQLQNQIGLPNDACAKEPVANMKLLLIILLAVACQAYTPIAERSWLKFRKVKDSTYESSPLHREPDIIHATDILIEERISKISTMVRKSVSDFHAQMKQYTTELTERIKRATTKVDYGFVRKPELRHQYGMLFNHHGQVISGLKNMDLFLSIDLPKVEDIAHVPPPFPDCDNWATPHKSNRNQHVYYSAHGFGRNNHGPMTELNTNTSEYLAEAIHITVCNQYKNKYIKLLEQIETIK